MARRGSKKVYNALINLSNNINNLNHGVSRGQYIQSQLQAFPNSYIFKQAWNSLPQMSQVITQLVGNKFGPLGRGIGMGAFNSAAYAATEVASRSNISDELLRRSLTLNRSLDGVTDSLPESARGGIFGGKTGIITALNTKLDLLEKGIKTSTGETFDLALQMKTLGQDTRGFASFLAANALIGGLTNTSLDSLSKEMMETRDKYQISTDRLIEGMSRLSKNMELGALGVTGQFESAAGIFQGKKGVAGAGDMMSQFIENFIKGNNLPAQALTNTIGDIKQLLTPGLSGEATESLIERIIAKVGQYQTNMSRNISGPTPAFGAEIANTMLGGQGFIASRLLSLTNQSTTNEKQNPFKTLSNTLEKLETPLVKLTNFLLPSIINNLEMLVAAGIGFKAAGMVANIAGPLAALGAAGAAGGISFGTAGILTGGIGLAVFGAIWALIKLLEFNSEDDKRDAEQKRLEDARTKALQTDQARKHLNTNNLLEVQSENIKETMRRIFFSSDLNEKLLKVNQDQLDRMERIMIGISKLDKPPAIQMAR